MGKQLSSFHFDKTQFFYSQDSSDLVQMLTVGLYKSREQFLKGYSVRGEREENTEGKGGL